MNTRLIVSGLITITLVCITIITAILLNQPATVSPQIMSPTPTPSIFVSDVPFIAGNTNLTTAFNTTYPKEARTSANQRLFAQAQVLVVELPGIYDSIIIPGETTSKAITAYLLVAFRRDILTDHEGITAALQAIIREKNKAPLQNVRQQWIQYQRILLSTPVPPQALVLHKSVLGYTELVIKTFDQIALFETDPIKSLTAMYQLEILDRMYYPTFTDVADTLQKL